MSKTKSWLAQFWDFIWSDDSIWSWMANLVLAFVIIKFVLFPVLSLVLGSAYPVVAVVSGSMEHDGNFNTWWNSPAICSTKGCTQADYYAAYNITEEQFKTFNFVNGFNKGDVMILTSPATAKIGDVIVYFASDGRPIIHRMISTNPTQTKGDHNQAQIVTDVLNEKQVSKYVLIGKASFRIPFIGYIKILFVDILSLFGVHAQ